MRRAQTAVAQFFANFWQAPLCVSLSHLHPSLCLFPGMNSPDWRQISSGAKAVVRGLLEVNRDQRMGMAELRSHPWLTEPLRVIERERFQNGDEGSRHGLPISSAAAMPSPTAT